MNGRFEGRTTLWVIHMGMGTGMELRARDLGFVAIGWHEMGDLRTHATREAMKAAMTKTWPDWSTGTVNACYGQVFRFAHTMRVGDPVVLPIKSTREIAIGRIASDYIRTQPGDPMHDPEYQNARRVEWLSIVPRTAFSQAALRSFGSFSTVSTSDDHLEEVSRVLDGAATSQPKETTTSKQPESTSSDVDSDAATDLYEAARQETEDYLLKRWIRTGYDFEHVVAATLRALGYTATVTPPSGDHGIDVLAHPDPLGLEKPYVKIQVKSGESTVGERELNQLKGTLNEGEHGIIVSLGGFTKGAEHVARSSRNLQIIGPRQFVDLFLDHYDQLDPVWQARYALKRVFVPVK